MSKTWQTLQLIALAAKKTAMATQDQIERARWIVEREDYLPWADVKAAKELLGIKETEVVSENVPNSKTA